MKSAPASCSCTLTRPNPLCIAPTSGCQPILVCCMCVDVWAYDRSCCSSSHKTGHQSGHLEGAQLSIAQHNTSGADLDCISHVGTHLDRRGAIGAVAWPTQDGLWRHVVERAHLCTMLEH